MSTITPTGWFLATPSGRTLRAVNARSRTRLLLLLPALALVALTAACGDDDDGAASVAAADLDGRTFVSTSVEGQTLVEGSEVSITFEDGSISVLAGCNTIFGGYELDGSTLAPTGQLATTQMACDDALMAQDEWLAAMLSAGPEVSLDGDELTLSTDDVTLTATESS